MAFTVQKWIWYYGFFACVTGNGTISSVNSSSLKPLRHDHSKLSSRSFYLNIHERISLISSLIYHVFFSSWVNINFSIDIIVFYFVLGNYNYDIRMYYFRVRDRQEQYIVNSLKSKAWPPLQCTFNRTGVIFRILFTYAQFYCHRA